MTTFVWSEDSDYFLPLCGVSLKAENARKVCVVCVVPIPPESGSVVDTGTCFFMWDGVNWQFDSDACYPGYVATEPHTPGDYVGEVREGTCV